MGLPIAYCSRHQLKDIFFYIVIYDKYPDLPMFGG